MECGMLDPCSGANSDNTRPRISRFTEGSVNVGPSVCLMLDQALWRTGVAQLTVRARPAKSFPFSERTAVSAKVSSSSSTNPKPRGLLVARSWMISTTRVLKPCEKNHSARASSVFVYGMFPTNSLFKVTSGLNSTMTMPRSGCYTPLSDKM